MFELNTTNSTALGIPARTVRITIANATLNVIGFKATGSMTITISPNHFRIEVPKTSPLSLVLGPLNIALYGFFDAFNGVVTFSFTATGGFHVRAGPAYLDADATLTITDHSFSFHISGAAGLEIAGFKIGISVSADITISNNHLDVAVRGCVDLLVDEACLTVHFSLGDLDPPGASQVPPPPVLATKLPERVLRLNIGSYASARNGFGDVTDETFIVTHVGGGKGTEDVSVSAFGLEPDLHGHQPHRRVRRRLRGRLHRRSWPACSPMQTSRAESGTTHSATRAQALRRSTAATATTSSSGARAPRR